MVFFWNSIISGQILAGPSHHLDPQNVAFWKGIPKFSGKSRLVKYYSIWPDCSLGEYSPMDP